jgi:lipoyl-dependent peroxiredoxin
MRMAAIRTAEVSWSGDLQTGSGMLLYVSSGALARLPVSWAARTESHGGKTSPEELLAAAHASCFSMALSARLAKNGTPAENLQVVATVSFDNPDGAGWKVASSALTVHGRVPGIDDAKFRELAEDAKENCPISVALKGNVELSVEPTLETA